GPNALLRRQQAAHMRRGGVVVRISIERMPGGDEPRIVGAAAQRGRRRLERVAGKGVELVVFLAGRDDGRGMRMIVDRLDAVDRAEECGIGPLAGRRRCDDARNCQCDRGKDLHDGWQWSIAARPMAKLPWASRLSTSTQ